jgi:hypothetical protein
MQSCKAYTTDTLDRPTGCYHESVGWWQLVRQGSGAGRVSTKWQWQRQADCVRQTCPSYFDLCCRGLDHGFLCCCMPWDVLQKDCMGVAALLYEAHQTSSACHCVRYAFTMQCAKAPVYVLLAVALELPYTVAMCCRPAFRMSPHAVCYHLHPAVFHSQSLVDRRSQLAGRVHLKVNSCTAHGC